MISLYNDLLYGWTFLGLGFSCFFYSCCMHILKSLYFLFIGSLLWFFKKITTLMAFHFIFTSIDSVKKENTFHFENLEVFFIFFYYNFVV